MTTTSQTLLELVAAALIGSGEGYATKAGKRVYTPGDWPTWDNQYPVLKLRVANEEKQAIGHASINFTVTTTVRVLVQVSEPASDDDGGAGKAEDALWLLQRQIEVAVINSQPLTSQIQQFPSIRSQSDFNAEGEKHLGSMQIDIALEFYQGVADFAPIPSDAIELAEATVLSVNPLGSPPGPDTGIAIDLPQ